MPTTITSATGEKSTTSNGFITAMDAATGKIRWSFASGGAVLGGASIVDGTVYWGSGCHLPENRPNNKLFAFSLPEEDRQ